MKDELGGENVIEKGWPVVLRHGDVKLRPLAYFDRRDWENLRKANQQWLAKWDATSPYPSQAPPPSFARFVRIINKDARRGTTLPFAVAYRGRFVGQLTVASITRGSMWSAMIGYWVSQDVAGRGIIPTAVAMTTDHCFEVLGLNRIEIAIRPQNGPSLRLVEKLGFRDEGLRERHLHINGKWADHRVFALTSGEVPQGLLTRWLSGAEINLGDETR